jgi:hypothetical protein
MTYDDAVDIKGRACSPPTTSGRIEQDCVFVSVATIRIMPGVACPGRRGRYGAPNPIK